MDSKITIKVTHFKCNNCGSLHTIVGSPKSDDIPNGWQRWTNGEETIYLCPSCGIDTEVCESCGSPYSDCRCHEE